jgi:ABC-type arginine transport system ATPase subunit
MPIYWGCPNIDEYFPEDSYHLIDITADDAVEQMHEIIQQPITNKNIEAMREARELILDKYNIWPALHEIINNKI